MQLKSIKILWIGLICYSLTSTLSAQDSYQSSVYEGFSIKVSGLLDFSKSEIMSESFTGSFGTELSAGYGLTDNFSIFGAYQFLFPSKLQRAEIGFLLYTDKISHQNFITGLKYTGGSPSSEIRYSIEAGYFIASSTAQIFQKQNGNYVDVDLHGGGLHTGLGFSYFSSPFLSFDINAGFNTGKYHSSEYLGISYTETLKWTKIQCIVGVHYHFAGR
ncbi:MAG: hypothetical protein LC107_08990 [Chitinophagales bacterium]|nr:hypothetical protein [Chitinophagales bacterium]